MRNYTTDIATPFGTLTAAFLGGEGLLSQSDFIRFRYCNHSSQTHTQTHQRLNPFILNAGGPDRGKKKINKKKHGLDRLARPIHTQPAKTTNNNSIQQFLRVNFTTTQHKTK